MPHIEKLKKIFRYRHDEDVEKQKDCHCGLDRYKTNHVWIFRHVRYCPDTDELITTKNEYTFHRNPRNLKFYCTWKTRHGNTELMIITNEEMETVKKGGTIERDQYID